MNKTWAWDELKERLGKAYHELSVLAYERPHTDEEQRRIVAKRDGVSLAMEYMEEMQRESDETPKYR